MISFAIVDDHPVVRDGIQRLLETEGEFFLVWEASSASEALEKLEESSPKVLIVDLSMAGLSGYEVIRRVSKTTPFTNVLVLSMSDSEADVFEALRSGAAGYVLKSSDGKEIVEATKKVADGRHHLSHPFDDRLYDRYLGELRRSESDPFEELTRRQREVLQLMAKDRSTSEIAEELGISPRTVEGHRARMMKALGLETRTDVIRLALRRGLISL